MPAGGLAAEDNSTEQDMMGTASDADGDRRFEAPLADGLVTAVIDGFVFPLGGGGGPGGGVGVVSNMMLKRFAKNSINKLFM